MRVFLSLCLVFYFLYGNEIKNELSFNMNNNNKKILEYNKRYLDLFDSHKKDIRGIRKKTILTDKELLDLNNIQTAQTPLNKILKNIDYLNMHIKFPMTLVFPHDIKIIHVKPFPENIDAIYWNNIIDLTAKGTLTTSTLSIKYLKNKTPGIMNIIVNRYNLDIQKDKTNYLVYPIIKYNHFEPEPIKSVLSKFKLANNNQNPKNNDSVEINKVVYRFIEDPFNGYLVLGDKNYTVNYNYK